MAETARLTLPLLDGAQALKHVTHNEALLRLDGATQLVVETIGDASPPGSPAPGATYAIGASATDDWSGQDGDLGVWTEAGWRFVTPGEGWRLWNKADGALHIHLSGDWTPYAGEIASLQDLALLGVNATADATNRLAVRSNAALFNALEDAEGGSGDLRLTLNKETSGDTVSLVFQSAFSGRAEMGLAGSDDFAFKVSADGVSFDTAFSLASSNGFVTFNRLFGAEISNPAISAGTFAVTTGHVVPEPETGTADDIDTISGGFDGALLVLGASSGDTLTCKDATGNLRLGADRVLDDVSDSLLLVRRGGDWVELSYANNG